MKKKVLIYAHYFYPDVASTGQILTELALGLKEKFDITVICVVPSYEGKIEEKYITKKFYFEEYKDLKIVRVSVPKFNKGNKMSRIKNILSYFINSMHATFKVGAQDIVFTISQPPILGGLLGVFGKIVKRAKLIYNIQDFNPEQTETVGYAKNKFIIKVAMGLDKFSCKKADKIIVVGRDMQETLKNRFNNKNVPKSVFINNWINEKEIYPLHHNNEKVIEFKKKYGLENKTVIMYSGNIGLYYDLENLIKVIGRFNDREDVVFAFVGDGTKRLDIETYVNKNKLKNVKFIPYQNKEDLIYSLNAGDIHWVVNAKGIKGISVPSKLYGVMAVGKPILGVLEEGSEGRLIIKETGCGYLTEPGQYEEIEKLIQKFIDNKGSQALRDMGEAGRKYIVQNLTKDVSVQKYMDQIEL